MRFSSARRRVPARQILFFIFLLLLAVPSCSPKLAFETRYLPGDLSLGHDQSDAVYLDIAERVEFSKEAKTVLADQAVEEIIELRTTAGADLFESYLIRTGYGDRIKGFLAEIRSPGGKTRTIRNPKFHRVSVTGFLPFYRLENLEPLCLVTRFPDLEPGTIIHIKYRLRKAFPELTGIAVLARPFPVQNYRFVVRNSTLFPLEHRLVRDDADSANFAITETANEFRVQKRGTEVRDTADPTPAHVFYALRPGTEPGKPACLFGSWNDVAKWAKGRMWTEEVESGATVEKLARTLASGSADDFVTSQRTYAWVRDRIRYVGLSRGIGWEPQKPAETLRRGYGDCKDMAKLLTVLLRLQGINARLALNATRYSVDLDAGFPVAAGFDHCIVMADIDTKRFWFDCTAKQCGFGEIPWWIQGRPALPVGNDSTNLLILPRSNAMDNTLQTAYRFYVDGNDLVGEEQVLYSGAEAQNYRGVLLEHPNWSEAIKAHLESIAPGGIVDSFFIAGLDSPTSNPGLRMHFRVPNAVHSEAGGCTIPFHRIKTDFLVEPLGSGLGGAGYPYHHDFEISIFAPGRAFSPVLGSRILSAKGLGFRSTEEIKPGELHLRYTWTQSDSLPARIRSEHPVMNQISEIREGKAIFFR